MARRYKRGLQRAFIPGVAKAEEFQRLAQEVIEGDFGSVSPSLRRRIVLRAARSAALQNNISEAERFLSAAMGLEGPDSEVPAKARIAESKGDVDVAINMLRDEACADCRAVLLDILARRKGDQLALAWFAEQHLPVGDLAADGVITLCQLHLRGNDYEAANRTLDDVAGPQFAECPYLYFLRGSVRFAALLPRDVRGIVFSGIPLDVRRVAPTLPDPQLSAKLDAAISDFQCFISAGLELELRETCGVAKFYTEWCELLHPERRASALTRLRRDVADPRRALSRLQLALAHDRDFDAGVISRFLKKREEFGGLDDEEARAALIIYVHSDDPRSVAEFIATHRSQLEAGFGKAGILVLEVEALAKAKDSTSARIILTNGRQLLDQKVLTLLEVEIAKAEGADPVLEHLRAYETTRSSAALRPLVGALIAKGDYHGVGRYAEELYTLTDDQRDLVTAAGAYARAGDQDNFTRIAETHPLIMEQNSELAKHYGWQLFRLGRLPEAKRISDELGQRRPALRDSELEIAIAIESGEWETLARPLATVLEDSSATGSELIRAAHLAQASGQGPQQSLMEAAIAKAEDNADVLIGAYLLVVEEGLEELKPEASGWFHRALDLSGSDGPIKQLELKDLLQRHVEWSEHSAKISEGVASGDMPLVLAATGLRTTLVDLLLRNLIRNCAVTDPRRRVAVPTFSGRRLPAALGQAKRVALDISSLLVMGWLGILPKVFESFSEFIIPAGTLSYLFEGRHRIRQFQKSRLRNAAQVQQALARGRLRALSPSTMTSGVLTMEVGAELAALLTAAKATSGSVVRPAPVHNLEVGDERDADLSAYAGYLTDTHKLLSVLIHLGAVDQRAEETAKRYFTVQDTGWPSAVEPEPNRPLYVDSLALVYLQTINLLENVLNTFTEVYIASSTEEELSALIDRENHTAEVLRVIDDIRKAIGKANAQGKIKFGPRRTLAEDDRQELPIMHLLSDLRGADAVLIDDRALNGDPFASDEKGNRARTVTTLDIIEELLARGMLSETERLTLRHNLRLAGAMLVPVDAEEVRVAALRNRRNESQEFRALLDNVRLARMADIPRFPSEIRWFVSLIMATETAIMKVWEEEPDSSRAASLSDAILDLRPKPEDWLDRWEGPPPPRWIEAVSRAMTAGLVLAPEPNDEKTRGSYNEWLEKRILEPMRDTSPEQYSAIVEYLKSVVLGPLKGVDDEPVA